jgi:hypothetical protein
MSVIPRSWGLDEGLKIPRHKIPACYEMLRRASDLAVSCEEDNENLGSIKERGIS